MTKPSLLAQSIGADVPDLPALTPVSGGEIAVTRDPFEQSAFVMFFDRRSTLSPRLLQACPGLQDGDPVLVPPEGQGQPVQLTPFRFSLFAAKSYFADVDQQGVIQRVSYEKGEGLREHVEALVFVYLADRLVPARCTFKTTKCLAVHKAVSAIAEASDPAWAKKSQDHAGSFQAPYPWARFSARVITSPRTSRSSGFKYVMADSTILPTTVGDWKLISEMLKGQAEAPTLKAAHQGYVNRLAEVDRVAKKGV